MRRNTWICIAVAFAVLASTGPALAGDFMDTRITWVFGDDDFLAGAGEKVPDSPLPSIGDREGYELFFDNLDSRFSGRENQTHLVVYKQFPGFIPKLTTEAALVMRIDLHEYGLDFGDDGTYLRIHYHTKTIGEEDGVSVILFPFDTERFRLGYLWDISWGGGSIFTNKRKGFAPGAKIAVKHGIVDGFVGFKTTKVSMMQGETEEGEPLNVQDTAYGFMGGVGVDIADAFKIDLGGGYFQQGTFEINGLVGRPVYTGGISLRLAYHLREEVGLPADFGLYRNHPMATMDLATPIDPAEPEKAPEKVVKTTVSAEATVLFQHLADPARYGSTEIQPAWAAALQWRLSYGGLLVHLTGFFRTATYILHNVPGFSPFWALPDEVDTGHELFVAAGASYYFHQSHLTPSLIVGLQMPAFYGAGGTTVVIRDESSRDILSDGDDALPILSARASLKWDLSQIMSMMLFIQYTRDVNQTRLVRDESGTFRTMTGENELGAALVVQARF